MIYLVQFIVSFVSVLFKGLQTQNVIGGNYIGSFTLAILMRIATVVEIGLIMETGIYLSLAPICIGAALGIVSSIYIYRRFNDG